MPARSRNSQASADAIAENDLGRLRNWSATVPKDCVSLASCSTDIVDWDRRARRYWPRRPFPPYRYLPGINPHPRRDPRGHSYAAAPQPSRRLDWDPKAWPFLEDWLWGVDLFNALYLWEAHEAWEPLWLAKPKETSAELLIHGLIQVAAAILKIRLTAVDGAAALSRGGLEKIARAAKDQPRLLGLDLQRVVKDFSNYFRPLHERTPPPVDASVPMLTLSAVSA